MTSPSSVPFRLERRRGESKKEKRSLRRRRGWGDLEQLSSLSPSLLRELRDERERLSQLVILCVCLENEGKVEESESRRKG